MIRRSDNSITVCNEELMSLCHTQDIEINDYVAYKAKNGIKYYGKVVSIDTKKKFVTIQQEHRKDTADQNLSQPICGTVS